MKKVIYSLIGVMMLAAFAGTTWFVYQKSQKKPVIFQTTSPFVTDIQQTTVASGMIIPRKEIEIKPQVPGIIDTIYVQAGKKVQQGAVLAKLRIVPNLLSLNEAENRLKHGEIYYENKRQELERQRQLYQKKLISESEYRRYQMEYQTAQADLDTARSNLRLVKDGVAKPNAENNTQITSTVDGTVLEVPVKEGATVIESNSYNAGTTIATVADMDQLIFEGKIDEGEIAKLQIGMELSLTIGAVEGSELKATLEYIAPKGEKGDDGTVQFPIKASVQPKADVLIRAGYSANAKIILAKKDQVLAIPESVVTYDNDQRAYVEVEVGNQQFEKRYLELGLSDGINVEILSGLTKDDKVKQQEFEEKNT